MMSRIKQSYKSGLRRDKLAHSKDAHMYFFANKNTQNEINACT